MTGILRYVTLLKAIELNMYVFITAALLNSLSFNTHTQKQEVGEAFFWQFELLKKSGKQLGVDWDSNLKHCNVLNMRVKDKLTSAYMPSSMPGYITGMVQ